MAQTGALTLNFGRSGALAGSFDGEELTFGSWERCGDINVLIIFGNDVPDNSITVVGTLAEGTDGLAIRGHAFQTQFAGAVEGAFQAKLGNYGWWCSGRGDADWILLFDRIQWRGGG